MRRAGKCLLSDLLQKSGMTQRQLSEITGISFQQINDFAKNRRIMSLSNARLIAKALPNCRIEDLYEWNQE